MYGVWERLSVLPPVKQFEAQPLTQEEIDDKLISKKDFRVTVEDGVYFVEADWLLDILRTANMDDYSSLQYESFLIWTPCNTPPLALAFIRDGVYEIRVREKLILEANMPADKLHKLTVERVCAEYQAKSCSQVA